ncbi:glutamate-1-semialdehyde 2,1-aminomutase [Flavobacteriales bacterium]|nr:glutamate-1-semialdehyde 2,1-aminomutase [Flavobacteriales bacterium]MDB2653200.1 glutamate-1-semialdehyde 2,1-aminomutase [Flavobacteriales bacterium]MDG1396464.1 glutamate-1-semialdehyde 2,1-aminomutase [Flavobacteriales bacterium]
MTSKDLFERAQLYIPGGVNSPVRAFSSVGGTPVFFREAKGSIMIDVEGKEYIDYIGSWGPMILGHSYPPVLEALKNAADKSTSFGAPTELETNIAELICGMVPGVEKVRMVNSGTEACMSAIRVARAFTNRDKFIKFEGCYHGHSDAFLIKAGSGAITLGVPNSPGVTSGTAKDTLLARYNDLAHVEEVLEANKEEVAAIIIEPVAGNMGCIPPVEGFLEGLRKLSYKHNAVLIFDEVMTGFRLSSGGAHKLYNIQPDLVCLGKIIGGGLPVGAFGGKKEIMDMVAPLGPVYQAGTLSGNPLAMSCGYTLLKELKDQPVIFEELENKTAYLEQGMRTIFEKHNLSVCINRVGSMLSFHFNISEVANFDDACAADAEYFKKVFHGMLKRGVYLAPSAFESLFISRTHTKELLDRTLSALDQTITEIEG